MSAQTVDPDIDAAMERLKATVRANPRVEQPPAPAPLRASVRQPLQRVDAGAQCFKGCPPDRDLVGSSQGEYQVHSDAHSQNADILRHLRRYFGLWFNRKWLREKFSAEAVNSRMANIRATVWREGLDVDQKSYRRRNGKLHSYYRLCRAEDSLRLKRRSNSGNRTYHPDRESPIQ